MHRDKLESSTGRRKKEDKERQRCLETSKEPENVARELKKQTSDQKTHKRQRTSVRIRPKTSTDQTGHEEIGRSV